MSSSVTQTENGHNRIPQVSVGRVEIALLASVG